MQPQFRTDDDSVIANMLALSYKALPCSPLASSPRLLQIYYCVRSGDET